MRNDELEQAVNDLVAAEAEDRKRMQEAIGPAEPCETYAGVRGVSLRAAAEHAMQVYRFRERNGNSFLAYIDSLPTGRLRLLSALMYLGRDVGDSAAVVWREETRRTRSECFQNLSGKRMQLAEYLQNGLDRLRQLRGSGIVL